MKIPKQVKKNLNSAKKTIYKAGKSAKRAGKSAKGAGKAALAGVAGLALMLGNTGRSIKEKASDFGFASKKKSSKSGEVVMKKSTLIALFVALAAVAGVLGALYVYVLRREKELDEYEQLLFSEEFDDDDLALDDEPEPIEAPPPPAKKSTTKA